MEALEEMQEKLDKKTRDAEAYRDMNGKLCKIIKIMVAAIIAVVLISGAVSAYCIHSLYSFESQYETTVTTSTENMQSGDGGVLINGDGNNSSPSSEPED